MIAQQSRYTSTIKQYYHLVFSKTVKMAEQSVVVRDISVKLNYKPEELYINQVYFQGVCNGRREPRTGRACLYWVITFLCEHRKEGSSDLANRLLRTSPANAGGSLFGQYFREIPTSGSHYSHTRTQTHNHNSVPARVARSSGYSTSRTPREGAHISTNNTNNRGPAAHPINRHSILTNSLPNQVQTPYINPTAPLVTNPRSSIISQTYCYVRLATKIHRNDMEQFLRAKDSVPVQLV